MLQDVPDLFHSDARKPLDKLRYERTVFQIFEQRCNRHSRPAEYPSATDALRIAFYRRARGPINH